MDLYKTVIRPNEHLKRDQDAFRQSAYPFQIWDAKAVLLKENRECRPIYQDQLHSYFNILHTAGMMEDEAYAQLEQSCGLSKEPVHTLPSLVYGLGRHWGPDVYLSTLILSNDLLSKEPHATLCDDGDWDYQFTPGVFRLGFSGRTLQDQKGKQYREEVFLEITPDMVFDFVANKGISQDRVGIVTARGNVEVVCEKEDYVQDMFPPFDKIKRYVSNSNCKKINLTTIVEEQGMSVVSHPFHEQTKHMEGLYVFRPKQGVDDLLRHEKISPNKAMEILLGMDYDPQDVKVLADTYATMADSVVWKLASLNNHHKDPNTFLNHASTFHDCFTFHVRNVSLGTTGRSVRQANNYHSDFEFPSNWQSEYISVVLDRNLLVSALFSNEKIIEQVLMYEGNPLGSEPWQIVYDQEKRISPQNKIILSDDERDALR